MKGSTEAAVALGVGYLLGRQRKFRRAAVLTAVTATGRFGGLGKSLVGRGLKAAESTELMGKFGPQLGGIIDSARGDLLDAGKAAAMGMVSSRIESLSDSLHSRAQALRDPAAAGTDGGDEDSHDDEHKSDEYGQAEEDAYDEDYEPADEYEADDRDEYEPDDRDEYEPDDRDEYEPDEQDESEADDRDESEADDRDEYASDDRDEYAPDGQDEYEPDGRDESEPDGQQKPDREAGSVPGPRRRSRVTSSPVSRAGR
jgi:hypothetical protein